MTELVGEPLAGHTTMRVGGPAARMVVAETTDELVDAVREVDDAEEPLLVLGGGSNLVLPDDGFPGTVVKVATRGVEVDSADSCGGANVVVAAGEPWDPFVERAVAEGWSGVEALSGIPGSTGATPVQNVGAYGQEVAQTIARVRVWDRVDQRVRTMTSAQCRFTYRHSLLKGTDRYVVLEVMFQLVLADLSRPVAYADLARQLGVAVGDRVPLPQAREAVLAQRRRRGMVLDEADHDTWSCGSFFTNPLLTAEEYADLEARATARLGADAGPPPRYPEPDGRVKTSAAWLIERAGFGKGFGLPGPVALSSKHALALTNRGEARAEDVVALAREIRDGVQAAFGVRLVNEPVLVGASL
ncbi:UDP-N-acetylmuramate dehydrogenase [Phycicoccus endophyticus]|uniref:UDP-N-acetylmuramate dehydrogenase n=1 Tax=Phycicoccus endophyticus TaxID=1690220 RepID=UPI00140A3CF1|nr:UDP-N-acetylmuramate dehydrogenase [Phycicoccus endophyticus]NHI19020.1 UDP-N-acetylmuramate dehydrogenase [Phycicoccus endophyticus]GGL32161.1 UDP-N-acetylenolpyruvoylglucosamine reductase [Phycicoccus endophyticus]